MSYISAVHKQDTVYVWERSEASGRLLKEYKAPYYFYYDDPDGKYQTIFDTSVSKIESSNNFQHRSAVQKMQSRGVTTWESDIPPLMRVLSNEYYGATPPKLNVSVFDIEVDYDPAMNLTVQEMVSINPYAVINSLSICHIWRKHVVVMCIPPDDGNVWTAETLRAAMFDGPNSIPMYQDLTVEVIVCDSEQDLLLTFLAEIEESDVLSGYNSDFFDMTYLVQRIVRVLDNREISLETVSSRGPDGTGKPRFVYSNNPTETLKKCRWVNRLDFPHHGAVTLQPVTNDKGTKLIGNTVNLTGRIHVDYLALIKKYEPGEKSSFKLEAIADDVLVDSNGNGLLPKLKYEGSLHNLYRENFAFFIRYNIRDTEILYGFEQKLGYIGVANTNYHLSTALMKHVTGTIKLAEYALINYCHHEIKRVVNDYKFPDIDRSISGALVLFPQVGLHKNVMLVDVASLYPNSIRSLNISPETLVGQFVRDEQDFQLIRDSSTEPCTLTMEGSGKQITKPANEWRQYFLKHNLAISGYGTIFDQSKLGFIPALLGDWFQKRQHFQKLKKDAAARADAILAKYHTK